MDTALALDQADPGRIGKVKGVDDQPLHPACLKIRGIQRPHDRASSVREKRRQLGHPVLGFNRR
jgi:hypothetical protein